MVAGVRWRVSDSLAVWPSRSSDLPTCRLTDYVPAMSGSQRALLIGSLLVLIVGAALRATPFVRADVELGHAGNVGGHGLTDTRESPGATCRFAPPLAWSLGETWIQVRPPVMFARDTTERTDHQLVGWRAVVSTWDRASDAWKLLVEGKTQRAVAAENRAAQFDSRGEETEFFLGYGTYLVTVDLFWYERMGPGEEPWLAGQAEYKVAHYAIAVRDRGGTRPINVNQACQISL